MPSWVRLARQTTAAAHTRPPLWRTLLPKTGTIPKWAIGMAVATPIAAAIQGSLMLQDYRSHHGDAPRPVSPSRGLVVVSNHTANNDHSSESGDDHYDWDTPLRLLVIGDSLAAGVGTSESGIPVLPESIARALSKASGGRAVHWTCIGTPGASASQIVHDITTYHDDSPKLLESKWVEWQAAKQRARDWFQNRQQQLQQQQLQLNQPQPHTNRIQQWWYRMRKDAQELHQVIRAKDEHQEQSLLLERSMKRRSTTLDPNLVAHYDIAVVLTGLNDLKDACLPFMMKGKNATTTPEAQAPPLQQHSSRNDLKEQLIRIIQALQEKMKLDLSETRRRLAQPTHTSLEPDIAHSTKEIPTSNGALVTRESKHQGPLVVFPAIPASPLPILRCAPLSWFLGPLIQMMEHNKKLLSQRFPGLVLFVDPPSLADFRDIEEGRGEVYANRNAEQVLLKLTDVTQHTQERVKQLMKQHYHHPTGSSRHSQQSTGRDPFEQSCHDHELVQTNGTPGSTLIAIDNIHPNDAGYDFWGRHIASAIVKEWNK